jgi:hormone-sensitive lipase
VRVNYPFQLIPQEKPIAEEKGSNGTYQNILSSLTKIFQKEKRVPKSVVFHIHGGGFISMSSFIHQIYTRIWATNLEVPIISVDYGKAPDRPFPLGLYDCLEAYIWTLQVFKQVYDVQPEKIVLVGDSAGGNLCAALVTLLLQWGLPVPAGIVLVYPALNLNFDTYTPSLLTALNDMILPHTFLKICLKAYIKDQHYDPKTDPFISPILTDPALLAKYPRTEILVGNKDPFHDDCCRFV